MKRSLGAPVWCWFGGFRSCITLQAPTKDLGLVTIWILKHWVPKRLSFLPSLTRCLWLRTWKFCRKVAGGCWEWERAWALLNLLEIISFLTLPNPQLLSASLFFSPTDPVETTGSSPGASTHQEGGKARSKPPSRWRCYWNPVLGHQSRSYRGNAFLLQGWSWSQS